jgi:hypothetical protein
LHGRSKREARLPEFTCRIYLQEIKSILKTIRSLHSWNKILEQEATKGVADLSKALKAAYGETLKVS